MAATTKSTRRLPAWIKLAGALILVLWLSLLPRSLGPWLLAPAAILLIALVVAKVRPLALIKRLLMLEPFVLGVALMALFGAGTWDERWMHFGFLVGRCTLALLTMLIFTATTPFAEILSVFQKMRVPSLLVTTMALMHRYLFVLADESARMRRARASRTFSAKRALGWRTLSTIIAQLFLRASDRADRIYQAMQARGWNAGD